MVRMLVVSVKGHGLDPSQVKPKNIKLVFDASPLSNHDFKDWLEWSQDNVSNMSTC